MKFNLKSLNIFTIITPFTGITGCLLVGYGIYASASHYMPHEGYSPVNHFISELGKTTASSAAVVFNRSLMTAGIFMMMFIIGLGFIFGKKLPSIIATITGILSAISFSAIGYYTVENWTTHKTLASVFFCGAMITVLFFSLAIWINKHIRIHSFFSFYGWFIVIFYFVALMWPKETLYQSVNSHAHFVRPGVWILPILEWCYCLMICLWILMLSFNILYLFFNEIRQHTFAEDSVKQ